MVPLKQLQEWLLTEIRCTSGAAVNHALVLALVESYQAVDAVQLAGYLQGQKRTYIITLDKICQQIEASCQYHIWCFESLQIVEGPYDQIQAHERICQLRALAEGGYVSLAAGSESERLFIAHHTSMKAKLK